MIAILYTTGIKFSTRKGLRFRKMSLVSILEKASVKDIVPMSTAGKILKIKTFFVSTFLDKYSNIPVVL